MWPFAPRNKYQDAKIHFVADKIYSYTLRENRRFRPDKATYLVDGTTEMEYVGRQYRQYQIFKRIKDAGFTRGFWIARKLGLTEKWDFRYDLRADMD